MGRRRIAVRFLLASDGCLSYTLSMMHQARASGWSGFSIVCVAALGLSPGGLLSGCSDAPSGPGEPGPLSPTAYARSAQELPPGTQIVPKAELDAMIASGDAVAVSLGTFEASQAAAARAEAADDTTIAEWQAAHPGRTLLPEQEEEPGSLSLANGTTLINVAMANGETRQFQAMGDRWMKAEIAAALRNFPTRANQLSVYAELYAHIPISYRDSLGLVDPAQISAAPDSYDASTVRALNDAIVARAGEIVTWQSYPDLPAGYVANCDLEEHAGEGTDRGGNDYQDPACKADPNGIWANVDFPMKWYATCVKDQANRGTCTSFATASAIELWVAKSEGRWVNLSEQALYRKSKFEWQNPRQDVADGFRTDRVLPSFGLWKLPYEDTWNYNPSLNRVRDHVYIDAPWYEHSCDDYDEWCSDSSHQTPLICAEVSGAMQCAYGWLGFPMGTPSVGVTTSAQIWNHDDLDQSIQLMRLALWMGFPLVLGFDCGWYCGHAVNVVGFVDNNQLIDVAPTVAPGAGGGYFIIKNSYTNCNGDAGYDYFEYDTMRANAKNVTALHGVTTP
jgi:hypothetical protein